MEFDASLDQAEDERPEEAIAIRDAEGNVFLIAVKNLPLHQIAEDKREGIESALSGASAEGFEMLGKVTLTRAARRASYAVPTVNHVVNIASPTS